MGTQNWKLQKEVELRLKENSKKKSKSLNKMRTRKKFKN